MHLCSILQNNENSMGNNLDKYNEYEKAYKKICEERNVWENSAIQAMLSNMKNNICKHKEREIDSSENTYEKPILQYYFIKIAIKI